MAFLKSLDEIKPGLRFPSFHWTLPPLEAG
jgi:hypothetical protein